MKKTKEHINKWLAALRATKLRRQNKICRAYELKIDFSHLSKQNQERLKMMFVEAKWIYNHILNQKDIFKIYYKTLKRVLIKNKDGEFIEKEIKFLKAKNIDDVLTGLKQNIKSLSRRKKKGMRIGILKFKSEYNSIELSNLGQTHQIINNNKIRINGFKKPFRVHGLEQIRPEFELANAKLIHKPDGYYISIITFQEKDNRPQTGKLIGIDFGIKNSITTSNGDIFNISVEESDRLKMLSRRMLRKTKGSNNRDKINNLLKIEYKKLTNKKRDKANKIISKLLRENDAIFMQDENIAGWQSGWFGKQVQHSALGFMKEKLKRDERTIAIEKEFASTKLCYKCWTKNEIKLDERIFVCKNCGHTEDRDIKSAKTILEYGKKIGAERIESTPVETKTSLIEDHLFVESLVTETGSHCRETMVVHSPLTLS